MQKIAFLPLFLLLVGCAVSGHSMVAQDFSKEAAPPFPGRNLFFQGTSA